VLDALSHAWKVSLDGAPITSLSQVSGWLEISTGLWRLQALTLSNSLDGADGAMALATEFQYLPQLQSLGLSTNRIGDDGAKARLMTCNVLMVSASYQVGSVDTKNKKF
jgi:hypothetical protein